MLVWTSAYSLGWPEPSVEVVDINYGGNSVACEGGGDTWIKRNV